MPKRLRVTRLLAALPLALGVGISCSSSGPPQRPSTAVKVTLVERDTQKPETHYSARIEPATRVDAAFKVGGYITAIGRTRGIDGKPRDLQEGDTVEAAAELASVRRTEYMQKLGEAQAALGQAKASAEQANFDFERSAKLASTGAISDAELDSNRIRAESAQSSLDGAQVRVEEAKTALSDTTLKAPMSGVILKKNVEVGSLANVGTVAFSIADVSSVKAVFGVADVTLPRVTLGAPQTFTTEAYPNRTFRGHVTRVAPSADPKSRVFEIEVTVPNADGRLKTGMVAALALTSNVPGASKEAAHPLVPLSAIVRAPEGKGRFAVFVVEGDARPVARVRPVELGEYLGRVIPVTKGLAGGERVVVQGAGLLVDGDTVEVIP